MNTPITEDEYLSAKKTYEDYWSQYSHVWGQPTRKVKNLGITDEQYDVACKIIHRFDIRDKGNVSSHALARYILQFPDCPVVGLGVGQGSNEGGDGDCKGLEFKKYGEKDCITLQFGWGPMTE